MRHAPEKKLCVLIIDDSRSFRQYIAELLTAKGYEVKGAANGLEGLACIRTYDPDIVLLDVDMPILDGLGVLEQIDPEDRLYSVIMLSSMNSLEVRVCALERGADDYITKPCEEDELLSRVKAAERISRYKHLLLQARNESLALLEKYRETQNKLIAEQKLRALARMAAAIAHGINNPLGFVKSNIATLGRYGKIMTDRAERMLNGPLVSDIDKIRTISNDIEPLISQTMFGIERVSRIVERLLQLDLGGSRQNVALLDIAPMLKKFVEAVRAKYPMLDLMVDIPDIPMVIRCRNVQVEAAIENILENAIDSAHGAKVVGISVGQQYGDIIIKISDNGVGIPKEVIDRIFEPFFTTSDNPDRLGLGLTIAQNLISANGGEITIRPDDQSVTVVTVRFPEMWKNLGCPEG